MYGIMNAMYAILQLLRIFGCVYRNANCIRLCLMYVDDWYDCFLMNFLIL